MKEEVTSSHDQPARLYSPFPFAFRIVHGWTFLGLFLVAFSLAGGCSSERATSGAESLQQRVRSFWDARIAGDDLKAYNYEDHAKTGSMTATQYVRARSPVLQYKTYEVKGIEEQGDEATVSIDLRYRLLLPMMKGDFDLPMTLKEHWVRLDGQWYRRSEKKTAGRAAG
ncbi:MAG: hypothetical protein ACREQ3_20800 [Candidatus Binatia bacterium]